MKTNLLLVLLFVATGSFATTLRGDSSYWQCAAFDSYNKQWLVKSSYQRIALNKAKHECTSNSTAPDSCVVANEYCEMVVKGKRMNRHSWQCVAFDKMGKTWNGDLYRNRDDAAVGARQFCKMQSAFPRSCYVRLMTCKNKNQG
jgi:hypothetical protein